MADPDGPVEVDWSDDRRRERNVPALLAAGGLLVVAGLLAYDYAVLGPEPVVFGYDVGRLEWLWVACLWVDLVYLGAVVASDPDRARGVLRRLLSRPTSALATVVAAAVFLAGTVGPLVLPQPTAHFRYGSQPPLFTSIRLDVVSSCVNPVGDRCFGSLRFPFGTDRAGKSMLAMTVFGARVVVTLATVTTIVPVATVTGAVAAYAGGRLDRVLTAVAETVRTVPALLVFLVWRGYTGSDGSLFALVVSFGLVNWGNVAVLVRSRARSEVSKPYVRAAESAGAGRLAVVRDHLVPNVSRTAITAAVYQVPLFVTVEATLSFLRIGNEFVLAVVPTKESWGRMLGRSLPHLDPYWWLGAVPVAAFVVTVGSLSVLAGALQEALDPRGSR